MTVLATASGGGFVVDDSFARLDLTRLRKALAAQYWSFGMALEKVEARASRSWAFGLYRQNDTSAAGGGGGGGGGGGELVGFARLVTDRCSFYYLSDVWVDEALRGRGLGEFLVRAVLGQPGIADSGRGFLHTGDPRSPPFYTRVAGFQIVNIEHGVTLANGVAGATRWTMARSPGPLQPTGAVRPDGAAMARASRPVLPRRGGTRAWVRQRAEVGSAMTVGSVVAVAVAALVVGFVTGSRWPRRREAGGGQ